LKYIVSMGVVAPEQQPGRKLAVDSPPGSGAAGSN